MKDNNENWRSAMQGIKNYLKQYMHYSDMIHVCLEFIYENVDSDFEYNEWSEVAPVVQDNWDSFVKHVKNILDL